MQTANTIKSKSPSISVVHLLTLESEYHKYAVKLFQNLRLLRAFSSLKLNCKINKEERQLHSIETQNQDKELLTSRLEELLKAEVELLVT